MKKIKRKEKQLNYKSQKRGRLGEYTDTKPFSGSSLGKTEWSNFS